MLCVGRCSNPDKGRHGVTQFSKDNGQSPIHPAIREDLSELLAHLCDDALSEDDGQRLNQLLIDFPAARKYYLRYIAVHSALKSAAGSPAGCSAIDAQLAIERMTLDRFAGCTAFDLTTSAKTAESRTADGWRSALQWIASVSAIVLVATGAWWSFGTARFGNGERSGSAAPFSQQRGPSNELADNRLLVAEVTYVSSSAVWRNPNGSFAVASRVAADQTMNLERGQVELTYSSGARLLLTGPFDFSALPTGGILRRGELVASVPESGHGFTIETPHGKVIDLGTEFGVVVDDFGVSQVSVFEGKVETLPARASGATRDKIELTSGRAIQWTDRAIIPIALRGQRYNRPKDDIPTNQIGISSRTSIDEDFQNSSLSPTRWRRVGTVAPTARGLRLGNVSGAERRPYLLSVQEFDPSQGAISITCDVRFETIHSADDVSFALLTRSSDRQSKPGTPWQDMLARSMRCRITTDSISGEGMLEAGTKYEADREHMNISWGGFSRPQPGALYRLEMRDDGLNVSFTVSLADNPSIRKTITCRSLFRGSQNFIALEGSSAGTTVVERLVISQDGSRVDHANSLAARGDGNAVEFENQIPDSAQPFGGFVPTGGELLLKDDFNDERLDSRNWTTLGDVVLKNGQVQLGVPNSEQHIDTWRARPYLITKRAFDPADGPLIILGKATFSANFLHGYGGSFAVMTRAENTHGGGPGWENSILRRGVRFNFWPAAFGFDHSVEIHEKPAANIIALLAAEGFQISPSSRAYFFRIKDDGRSAMLTFVDALNPSTRKTLTQPTTASSLSNGRIGFESCWGSPVMLDSVRIYRER